MSVFKPGRWVVDSKGRVAVCYVAERLVGGQFTRTQEAHVTEPTTGETISIELWSETWKQAAHADIPLHRRPTAEVAHKFGYTVSNADRLTIEAKRADELKIAEIAQLETVLAQLKER